MSVKEAREIAKIAATADGNCPDCAGALYEQLMETFPTFAWKDFWKQEFGYDYD